MRIPINATQRPLISGEPAQAKPSGRATRGGGASQEKPGVQVSLSSGAARPGPTTGSREVVAYAELAHRRLRHKGLPPVSRPLTRAGQPAGGEPAGYILRLQRRVLQEHPVLRDEARAAIEARLLQDHGLRVNADRTYFNVFRGASSSRESYNGWQHHGAPLVSMSLTDLQMRNFPAALGEDPNGLDANSGVYTEGAGRTSFGRHNEVRLLSSELKRSVRANDVGGTYRDKLTAWWNRNEQAVATLYQAQVRKWRSHAGLSVEARAMLKEVLRRADGKAVQPKVTAHVFDINSYPSKDMTWLKGAGPRVVLIMPGGAPALREYANLDALREGIEAMARTAQGRAELTTHFSLYNRKDGSTYQGVEKWLGDIAAGGWRHRIAYLPQRIDGNIFADQAARTRAAELDDIKRLVKSNSEVIEEESTQFVRVLGQLFPEFFIPAKAVELALDVHQAVADGAAQDRRSAARDAVSAGINLAVAVAIGALSAPIRRASPPATGAVERSAFFNPPGRIGGQRIGYLLGPIEAPRPPSVFDDLLDEAERAHNPIDDWDDGTLTLSPSPSRSGTPTTDTASEPNDVSPASTRSSSPSSAPDRGWWAPGQEPVMGEPSAPATPPSSPAVSVPGFGEVGNHQGLPYFNALDWIERLDIPHVYRVQSIEELAGRSPEIEGFEPDMFIGGGGTTVHDRYLFSLETQQAAVDYGNSTFGAGNFAVFRIDTEGVPAMPYRLNINYDMWNASRPVVEARAAGQLVTPDVDWLANYVHVAPPVSGEVPAGYVALEPEDIVGYERGHVFLDNRAVTPSRIHRTI